MAESDEKMVLRTVYLPREIDDQLRLIAFRSGTTKGDLVRNFVKSGLAGHDQLALPKKANSKNAKVAAAAKQKLLGARTKSKAAKAAAKVA